ncbi:MAG: hypothetical protein JWP95_1954 [Actinotalea sp.]|nr:hypothetical protein [Actinotalea sp.]
MARLHPGPALTALGAALLLVASTPAAAAPPPGTGPTRPDAETIVLPAGLACPFALRIDLSGGVRVEAGAGGTVISAGTGSRLVFTNLDDPTQTLTTRSSGAVSRTTVQADGTTTTELLGHNLLVLFPTDVPPGPSSTLYTGRVRYTVGTDGTWTLVSARGTSVDVCAELGG